MSRGPRSHLPLAALIAAGVGCGAPARPGTAASAPASAGGAPPPEMVTPSRLVPDVARETAAIDTLADGTRRLVVSGMRILDHPDGSMERADDLAPAGTYRVVDLPPRLGSGILLVTTGGGGTQIWRAASFIAPLEPFARLNENALEVIAGFDRIYARMPRGELVALDPDTGREVSLGPLPTAARIGPLAFADGWRAVAVLDLRGPVATFDAGTTWSPVALEGQVVTRASAEGGDLVLDTLGGRFVLGADGQVLREAPDPAAPKAAADRRAPTPAAKPPLGHRPLRAALEDGWPDSPATAIVLRAGTLYRVRLADGAIDATRPRVAAESDGRCHGIAVGPGFGFVCGSPGGQTSVYGFEPPFSVRQLMRFAGPRFVSSSGNGWIVVRGGCARLGDGSAEDGTLPYCVRSPAGQEHEIRVRGEVGVERVVALADGRVVVLVPPRGGAGGQLTVLGAGDAKSVPLSLEDHLELGSGLWLDGMQERAPGVLGGWVDTGGWIVGVEVQKDGKVAVGTGHGELETTMIAGRFALDVGGGGNRPMESSDFGMTWSPVELASDLVRAPFDARTCGPVGCAGGGWLKVGWGKPREHDGVLATAPKLSRSQPLFARGLSWKCEPTGEATAPPPAAKKEPPSRTKPGEATSGSGILGALGALRPHPAGPAPGLAVLGLPPRGDPAPTWLPLRGMPAPALGKGDVGVDVGSEPSMLVPMRAYAWGPKGSDWTRTGRWLARFDDRFDLAGLRSSAPTLAPWADEDRAAEALGAAPGSTFTVWNAKLDPGGTAAVLIGCRAGRCELYGAAQGEPIVRLHDVETGARADELSAVRVGQTWFVAAPPLGMSIAQAINVFRVDGGVGKKLVRLPRVSAASDEVPRLVRRAHGPGVGLLVKGAPALGRNVRDWYVVPIDAETGEPDDPVRLLGSDLDSKAPPRCTPDDDGWVVDTQLALAPLLRVTASSATSPPSISAGDLRLRLDPGRACIEAIAGRGEGLASLGRPQAHAPDADARAIPLAVTEPSTGRRYLLRCTP